MTAKANDSDKWADPEQLFQAAVSGDNTAESILFRKLTVRFRLIAKRYAVNTDAEDLAQEACMTIHEKYRSEKYSKSFYAWAYGVLRMKIGNYLQHKKGTGQKEVQMLESVGNPDEVPNHEIKRFLRDCLKSILKEKPRYARILNLSHQGYSTEQICDRIRMKANHYYVSLNRSRSLLKACLDRKGVSF